MEKRPVRFEDLNLFDRTSSLVLGTPAKGIPVEVLLADYGAFNTCTKKLKIPRESQPMKYFRGVCEPHVTVAHEAGHFRDAAKGTLSEDKIDSELSAWRQAFIGFMKAGNYTPSIKAQAIDSISSYYEGMKVKKPVKKAVRDINMVEDSARAAVEWEQQFE